MVKYGHILLRNVAIRIEVVQLEVEAQLLVEGRVQHALKSGNEFLLTKVAIFSCI